jgi:hypothetical protein
MKIDETKSVASEATCEEDRQNRREFFNGLGKWSMIVVAAVSFLRGSATGSQASREDPSKPEPEPQRPAWAVPDDGDPGVRVAGVFRPRPHGNYTKNHSNYNVSYPEHTNQNVIQ